MLGLTNIIKLGTRYRAVASMTLTTGSPYNYYVVASVPLPTLVKKGSLLMITTNGEVTNSNAYNIGVGQYLCLGTTSTDTGQTAPNYIQVPTGENIINSGSNHIRLNTSEQYEVMEDLSGAFVNFVCYAYSSSAAGGATATVENSISLIVTIFSA